MYPRSRQDGTSFHIIWNNVPYHLEHDSILAITRQFTIKFITRAYKRENKTRKNDLSLTRNGPIFCHF
ncbi:MAG: hypothetical protein D8H98_10590 [Prevotella sp.]|nr:MAG: hypothetical protein D8H98_10590 [Prevotella sp.]